ncbi:MAG: EAL domain-containing protein [Planktomarina sp.]
MGIDLKQIGNWHCFAPDTRDFGTLSTGLGVAAAVLAASSYFGPTGGLIAAATAPFILWGLRLNTANSGRAAANKNYVKICGQVHHRTIFNRALNEAVTGFANGASNSACYVLRFENIPIIRQQFGDDTLANLTKDAAQRLADMTRDEDIVCALEPGVIAVCANSIRRFDIESGLQIAERLQSIAMRPPQNAKTSFAPRVYVGFCLASRAPKETGDAILEAAFRALNEACTRKETSVFAYSKSLGGTVVHPDLTPQVEEALNEGQITPYFQPQVDTVTGELRGVEALARWIHPVRGIIPPLEFLAAVKAAGCWHQMTDSIMDQALARIAEWDALGVYVPQVGVNFEEADLVHPHLLDRIKWTLGKHSLPAYRLGIEVTENVIGETNSCISELLQNLSDMGCMIELDDFGTGHAAISTLRQIPANRLKIDRSFVIKIDQDGDQQNMMAAILMMADKLGLETLAEGVETEGEHKAIRDAGCQTIQGFGIGRPMPAADLPTWARENTPDRAAMPLALSA